MLTPVAVIRMHAIMAQIDDEDLIIDRDESFDDSSDDSSDDGNGGWGDGDEGWDWDDFEDECDDIEGGDIGTLLALCVSDASAETYISHANTILAFDVPQAPADAAGHAVTAMLLAQSEDVFQRAAAIYTAHAGADPKFVMAVIDLVCDNADIAEETLRRVSAAL